MPGILDKLLNRDTVKSALQNLTDVMEAEGANMKSAQALTAIEQLKALVDDETGEEVTPGALAEAAVEAAIPVFAEFEISVEGKEGFVEALLAAIGAAMPAPAEGAEGEMETDEETKAYLKAATGFIETGFGVEDDIADLIEAVAQQKVISEAQTEAVVSLVEIIKGLERQLKRRPGSVADENNGAAPGVERLTALMETAKGAAPPTQEPATKAVAGLFDPV